MLSIACTEAQKVLSFMTRKLPLQFESLAVHAGGRSAINGQAAPAVPPIVPSVGFLHPTLEETDAALSYAGGTPFDPSRHVYARYGAPNQAAFEEAVASLEGAEGAVSFSSGMAAMHAALLALVPPGGRVVAASQLYGVTRSLLDWLADAMSIQVQYGDFTDGAAAREMILSAHPHVIVCEVLTNPLVRIVPLDIIGQAAHDIGAAFLVDNTFTTPYLLRPLEYGASIVVHSTTKFLNGHGDVLGGIAAGASDLISRVYQHRKILGAMPGAFDSWLALRGLRTLVLRMRQACANASQIAGWLFQHPLITKTYYPGLPDDSGYSIAKRLLAHGLFGSMIAFEIAGLDRKQVFNFVRHLQIIQPVTSLGDVYSLVLHPASASHRALTAEQREMQGITEGVLRLSVGIEAADDLIDDLDQALQAII
jgi:cystathionine gamma-synthase/methionine-gamma-lyase